MRTERTILTLAAICLLAATSGCHMLPKAGEENLDWLAEMAGQKEEDATQIVTIWTDASLKKAGTVGDTRGFGGRLYFYDAKQRPVKVQGELTVYAFIEKDRETPSKLPDRKFVFTEADLENHYSRTALGHSYNIWLPWDKDIEKTISISLLPTLKTSENKVVLGHQSLNVLKGKEEDEEPGLEKRELTVQPVSAVRPVSYEERAVADDAPSERAQGKSSLAKRVEAAGFDSDLPLATGVDTMTVDLPGALGLAARARRAAKTDVPKASDVSKADPPAPANGTVFDLAQAARISRDAAPESDDSRASTAASERTGRSTKMWLSSDRRQPAWKRQESKSDRFPERSTDSRPSRFPARVPADPR